MLLLGEIQISNFACIYGYSTSYEGKRESRESIAKLTHYLSLPIQSFPSSISIAQYVESDSDKDSKSPQFEILFSNLGIFYFLFFRVYAGPLSYCNKKVCFWKFYSICLNLQKFPNLNIFSVSYQAVVLFCFDLNFLFNSLSTHCDRGRTNNPHLFPLSRRSSRCSVDSI